MTTKTRFIPTGYKEYVPEGDYKNITFACYTNVEQPHNPRAMFFIGKQSNPAWSYRFSTVEQMNAKIIETIGNVIAHEDRKNQARRERNEKRKNMDTSTVKVGDIYHWMGGYNCTKNAYVKVTEIVAKNKFKVIQLSKYQVSGDWMNGEVGPVLDSNNGEVILKARPGYNGNVMLRDTTGSYHDDYHKWNGKPNWENCD